MKNIQIEPILAGDIKRKVLEKMYLFRETYNAQPRFIMLSKEYLQLLKYDMSVYLFHDFDVVGTPHLFGMEICVSERVKTLDDIELY